MVTATKMITTREQKEANLLSLKLSLEEFSAKTSVCYDDRWRWHEWRVQGDESLNYWIFDCIRDSKERMFSDDEVVKLAFERLQAIQERNGQLNVHSVYVGECDEIAVVPRRKLEHAVVRVVQDCVDMQWRWATSFWVGNGGRGSPLSFTDNIVASFDDAILAGAECMKEDTTSGWEYQQGGQTYKTFVNKIDDFIGNFKAQIIQPSLFS